MLKMPTQPQTIRQVSSLSMKLYGYSFFDALPYSLALSMVIQAPFLGYGQNNSGLQHLLFKNEVTQTGLPGSIIRFTESLAINLPLTLLGLILFAALICKMNSVMSHKIMSLTEGFVIGVRKLPQMFLLTILYNFLCAMGFILLATVFFANPTDTHGFADVLHDAALTLNHLSGTLFFFTMLFIFLSLPSVYFSIAVAFSFGNLLVFHQSIKRAILQSLIMAWGNFWRIATVLSIPLTAYSILFALCGCLVSVVLGPHGMQNKADVESMFSIFLTLLNTLMFPCVIAFYLTQLYDLKSRHAAKETLARLSS